MQAALNRYGVFEINLQLLFVVKVTPGWSTMGGHYYCVVCETGALSPNS